MSDPFEDFLNDNGHTPPREPTTPLGGNLSSLKDLKPKDLPRSVMSVYQQLGGDAYLLQQALLNPKEFLSLLKTIMPKNINIDLDQNITVGIAPAYNTTQLGVIKEELKILSQGKEPSP